MVVRRLVIETVRYRVSLEVAWKFGYIGFLVEFDDGLRSPVRNIHLDDLLGSTGFGNYEDMLVGLVGHDFCDIHAGESGVGVERRDDLVSRGRRWVFPSHIYGYG